MVAISTQIRTPAARKELRVKFGGKRWQVPGKVVSFGIEFVAETETICHPVGQTHRGVNRCIARVCRAT